MPGVALSDAATVTVIVHGVGDHSSRLIMQRARAGLEAVAKSETNAEIVELAGLPDFDNADQPVPGLQITAGDQTHYLIPLIWSRMRPRAANESDFLPAYRSLTSGIFERLFQSLFLLSLVSFNSIRCIPAATGWLRRSLVALIALMYTVFVPVFCIGGFLLAVYLTTARAELDNANHRWWRILVFLAILLLLNWIIGKTLMIADFFGDVAAYVGSPSHCRDAKNRLLKVIRAVANQSPGAQIFVVGHSLGSVLVTHTVLQLNAEDTFGRRLWIITMGSPLNWMSWFFPELIDNPSQLVAQYDRREVVASWANLWRDADWIGRALKATSGQRFCETSLGDGGHADYWADPRCWRTLFDYLRAVTSQSFESLRDQWKKSELTEDEIREFVVAHKQRSALNFIICLMILVGLYFVFESTQLRTWFNALGFWEKLLFLGPFGLVWTLVVVWYFFTTSPIVGATPRERLARYRLNWNIAVSSLQTAIAITAAIGLMFVLWITFTA